MVAFERTGAKHATPGDLEGIRSNALEELAEGRGVTPAGMARQLAALKQEAERLLREEPDHPDAKWWRWDVERLGTDLAKPPDCDRNEA